MCIFISTDVFFIKSKKTGILSLNVRKLINLHLVCNTIQKLHWGSLFFIPCLILVQILSESLPKYGITIINSFLGTALTAIFGLNTLFKKLLNICLRSHVGNYFYTKYFLILISWRNFATCEPKLKHWNNNDLIKLHWRFFSDKHYWQIFLFHEKYWCMKKISDHHFLSLIKS